MAGRFGMFGRLGMFGMLGRFGMFGKFGIAGREGKSGMRGRFMLDIFGMLGVEKRGVVNEARRGSSGWTK